VTRIVAMVLVWAAGCEDPQSLAWRFTFESAALKNRAVQIDAEVLAGGCGSSEVVYRGTIRRGVETTMPSVLESGTYGFRGRALDAGCVWFAETCREIALPLDDGAVDLVLAPVAEVAACAPDRCVNGTCGQTGDAGVDGSTCGDEVCNELDDDCDMRADEAFDLVTDEANCGRCGRVCGAGERCNAGECTGMPAQVATGGSASCLLMENGAVYCCGTNRSGILGESVAEGTLRTAPSFVEGVEGGVELAMGGEHALVLTATGAIRCWGGNAQGQCGTGTLSASTAPVQVSVLADVVHVAAGTSHSCAVRNDGRAFCWGSNTRGQLGIGGFLMAEPIALPRQVLLPSNDAVEIAAGLDFTCARFESGSLACWGENRDGQLGTGIVEDYSTSPRSVSGVTNAIALAAGTVNAYAVRGGGALVAWGDDDFGSVGDWSPTMDARTPEDVVGLARPATRVRAGSRHACAVLDDGRVQCWGDGANGELGNGRGISDRALDPVSGLADVVWLSEADSGAYCAIREGGSVVCWGDNDEGRLCDGTTSDRGVPTTMQPLE
jgi:alpha-tubulin suppressor-like RCC1 family protein